MKQAKLFVWAGVVVLIEVGGAHAQQSMTQQPMTQPRIAPIEPVEMIYEPKKRERYNPVSDWQLMFAAHLTAMGPVGPFAFEVSADLAKYFSLRFMMGYVDDDYEHFGIAPSHLEGLQLGGFATARVPLGRFTLRPGIGLSAGEFDGSMIYQLDSHPWAEAEFGPLFSDEPNDSCVFGCNEDVHLDGVLWAHVEMSAQYRFSDDFFLRAYGGASIGMYGWGLQDCRECSEQERDDKSGDIFGHATDLYAGVALGWAIDLSQ